MSSEPAAPASTATAPVVNLRTDQPAALLMGVGVASLLHVVTLIGRGAVATWPVLPFLPLLFFGVALLAFYRHRWTRLYRPYGSRTVVYIAELVVLILLTRLIPLLTTPQRLLSLIPQWWSDPSSFLFDGPFLVSLLFVAGAWGIGHSVGAAVDQLHLQHGEVGPTRGALAAEHWERTQGVFDHRAAFRHLTSLVLGGGIVAIIALGAVVVANPSGSLLPEGILAVGLYLICGLVLLAWAHVTLLDTLWRTEGLAPPTALFRRWPLWLATILVVVGVLALVAPRSYSLDPIALVLLLVQFAASLFQLFFFLIALPFIWLASLFGLGSNASGGAPPPTLPPIVTREDGEWAWLATLRSLGFWLLTIALAIYSLRVLVVSRWGALAWLPRLALWRSLVTLWRSLWGGLTDRAGALARLLRPALLSRAGAQLGRSRSLPRPTDPRGWIQFLYLSLIERAGRRGYPRRRGMTAAEYSRYLASRLTVEDSAGGDPAAARADLDALTAAFLAARYSRQPVADQDVNLARRALQRLLVLIRQMTTRR